MPNIRHIQDPNLLLDQFVTYSGLSSMLMGEGAHGQEKIIRLWTKDFVKRLTREYLKHAGESAMSNKRKRISVMDIESIPDAQDYVGSNVSMFASNYAQHQNTFYNLPKEQKKTKTKCTPGQFFSQRIYHKYVKAMNTTCVHNISISVPAAYLLEEVVEQRLKDIFASAVVNNRNYKRSRMSYVAVKSVLDTNPEADAMAINPVYNQRLFRQRA